jgi:hypothetical protein
MDATAHVLANEVDVGAKASMVLLWGGWFAALVPDLDAHVRLSMEAYAILASSVKRPVPDWPRLLQVRASAWCGTTLWV